MNENTPPPPKVMFKIFLSSTYLDLVEYRTVLDRQLRLMGEPAFGMEFFGASDKEPTELSLDELEKCNVYVGIIGHRFGTSPDGQYSIVQREYMRAQELHEEGKMRLLLYLADEKKVLVAPDLLGNDAERKKQKAFRHQLEENHSPQRFEDAFDLMGKVTADLFRLREDKLPPVPGLEFFEEGKFDAIKDKFDLAGGRTEKIEEFLNFLVKRLSTLFCIEPKQFDIHPLFRETRNQLGNIIPGVSLDDEEGILMRTGVPHVILRRETALLLVSRLDRLTRESVGEQIGRGAAANLIENTIEKKLLMPASAEAFVTLLDYWDRTGGWGKLTMVRPSDDEMANRARTQPQEPAEWRIQIQNNFLYIEGNIEETHELCHFWCGYLQGMLNEALPRIRKLMMQHSNQEPPSSVTLPAYSCVTKVEHIPDNELRTDIFRIIFQPEALSLSQQRLSDARSFMIEGKYSIAGLCCREAIRLARLELGGSFDSWSSQVNMDVKSRQYINDMLDENEEENSTKEAVECWFKTASIFIDALGKLIRPGK